MSAQVWVIRDETGAILGASVERRIDRGDALCGDGPYAAITNAFGAHSTLDAATGLTHAVENTAGDRFVYGEYVLEMNYAVPPVNAPPNVAVVRMKTKLVQEVVKAAEAYKAARDEEDGKPFGPYALSIVAADDALCQAVGALLAYHATTEATP